MGFVVLEHTSNWLIYKWASSFCKKKKLEEYKWVLSFCKLLEEPLDEWASSFYITHEDPRHSVKKNTPEDLVYELASSFCNTLLRMIVYMSRLHHSVTRLRILYMNGLRLSVTRIRGAYI